MFPIGMTCLMIHGSNFCSKKTLIVFEMFETRLKTVHRGILLTRMPEYFKLYVDCNF